MDTSYRFTSNTEPSDEQLQGLMQAALQDVRQRAAIADQKFKALQQQQLKEAMKKWKEKHGQNN